MNVDNANFYTKGADGKMVFDGEAGKQAYFGMIKRLGAPVYPRYEKEPGFFWAVDFAQGDFAKFGMGGVFWCNELGEGYFGHEIFLLPGQAIAEHKHMPTVIDGKPHAAKCESWLVRYGSVYGFSEVVPEGKKPNLDEYPEVKAMLANCQKPHLNCVYVEKWEADGIVHKLPKMHTWHFMLAGSEGAIVSEFGSYHDGNGLRFSCPDVAF